MCTFSITYFLGDIFSEYYFMIMPPVEFVGNVLSFMVSYIPFMFHFNINIPVFIMPSKWSRHFQLFLSKQQNKSIKSVEDNFETYSPKSLTFPDPKYYNDDQ